MRSASEQLSQFSRDPAYTGLQKMKGLAPHPCAVAQPTGQSIKLGWVYASVWGGGGTAPRPPGEGAGNLVLHHAGVVSAQIFDR